MRSNGSAIGRFCRRSSVNRAASAVVEHLEHRVFLSASVLSFRDGTDGVGVNDSEVQLTPANVKVGSFGKLFTVPVDGQVYAEPLVEAGVTITSGVNTVAGAAGVHNVVFVATENDTLYAIDSDVNGGKILWKRAFLSTTNSGGNQNNTLGATSITTLTSNDVGAQDIAPVIGITGTPVIDAANGIIYLVAKTKEVIGGKTYFVQRLHAINVSDGTDVAAPFLIGETTAGNTNTTQIYVYGTGDGHVTDPYNGTGKQVVQFNALREHQRAALSLVNNEVYVSWASHGDNGPYHGWIATWDVSHISTSGFKLSGVLNTSPNDGLSGVWQGSGALAFDPDENAFYFLTGNGSGGPPTLGANGLPTNANYTEALVKATSDPTTTATKQGPNGWGLKVIDFFTPYDVTALDNADSDFGSGAPIILPDSAGIPGHPHLMVVGGKDGKLFVLDRDNLGGYDPVNDHVVNAVPNGSGHNTAPRVVVGLLSTPAYFNGKLYAVSGYSYAEYAFTISSAGQLVAASQSSTNNFGTLPGSPFISANGNNNGIVWQTDRNSNVLRAFDATSLATQLWNSGQAAGGADNLGAVVKFAPPTVVNGEVYVGTANSLVVYGLTPPPGKVSNAPVLAATALSSTSINLTWTDSTVAPNIPSIYLIEESTDGKTFKQVATSPAGSTSIAIGGLNPLTKYYFRIRGTNSAGNSAYSNVANATTSNQSAAGIDFSGGFAGATGQLTLNGKASIDSTGLQLTDNNTYEASSAFYNTPLDVTNFSTQFTFQLSAGASTADGFTFTLQNAGLNALGSYGGGLGYGPVTAGGAIGITKSAMIKFDLYSNSGEGVDSTGLFLNGVTPSGAGSINLAPSGLDLHSGDVFQVNLAYNGTKLTETLTDTKTEKSVTESYTVNLTSIVGGTTAYAGFTGGTGGKTAVQTILSWAYSPSAATSPNAPLGLGATPATATSVSLDWTNSATNQTGYHLDRATDPNFTQNLITETLPASPAAFTDTATGLAPGSTFYYQLRAFNAAGDSGDSNVVSVTIPLAPPKPTLQEVENVTSTEIDIEWQDNAGHLATGYLILRAANHGSFSVVANLPPTSRTAPSPYEYADTNLTPGTYYEYHIQAVNSSGNNDFAGVNATTLTLPPAKPAVVAGTGVNAVSWSATTGAVSYNVYRGTAPGGEGAKPIATGITTTSYQDKTVVKGVKYYYKVTAVNLNATYTPPLPSESAPSAEVTPGSSPVTGGNLFGTSIDIGSPKIAGSASFANGIYTVTGQGNDIWNASDQFHYDYTAATGDTTISAQVTSVQNTYSWAKAGVMIRDGTAANAAFADVVVTPGGYVSFQFRAKAGGPCSMVTLTGKHAPQFVKLVRTGNTFSAFYSSNGTTWTQVGKSQTIAMGNAVTTGLAVTSVNLTKACTATFANVSVGSE
jgi:hypothetical protein